MKTTCQCGKKLKLERIKMRHEVLDEKTGLRQMYWLCPYCKHRYNVALEDDACREIKERMQKAVLNSEDHVFLERRYKAAMDKLNGRI